MAEILTFKKVKTRKPHRCHGCARLFPAGTELELIETIDNGTWGRSYWCPVCQDVWGKGDYDADEGVLLGELKQNDETWEETRQRLEAPHA